MSGSGDQSLTVAIAQALRFDHPDTTPLRDLDADGWTRLLEIADRMHITLALATRRRDALPDWVRRRVDRNMASHSERSRRIECAYREIASALEARSIEWVVLKGFSHQVPARPQYDIDLLCSPDHAASAQEAVVALGYEPITGSGEFPADHLPLLIRKTGWRWRNDYYDPEMPPHVEIHFRLWDASTERLRVEGLDDFWSRRERKPAGDFCFPAFDPLDTLAYASLHVLRHLLRGDLLLWHVYELAFMLDARAADAAFWSAWLERYPESLRRLLGIPCRLAEIWFGCRADEQPVLDEQIERWFQIYARRPAGLRLFAAKSELWLHVTLLESRADALGVIRRKLLPVQTRRSVQFPHIRSSETGLKLKIERTARHLAFIASRASHHLAALPPAIVQGLLWWLRSRSPASTNSRTSRT